MNRDRSPSPPPLVRIPKAASSSPLRLVLGLLALSLSLAIPCFHYQLFTFARSSANPYTGLDLQDPSRPEMEVVRSYFGGKDGGGVESWDLVASLYWRRERGPYRPYGEEKVEEDCIERNDKLWLPWERLYSDVVIAGIDGETILSSGAKPVNGTAKVVIPGRIVPHLRNGFGHRSSQLASSFHLLPSHRPPPSNLHPLASLVAYAESRWNMDSMTFRDYQPNSLRFPLPFPVAGNSHAQQLQWGDEPKNDHLLSKVHDFEWEVMLSRSLAVGNMLREGRELTGEEAEESLRGRVASSMGQEPRIVRKMWVAMARDAPVYELGVFLRQMAKLMGTQKKCHNLRRTGKKERRSCWHRFSNVGHFDSLVSVGTPLPPDSPSSSKGNATGWRYLPFLTTSLGLVRKPDLISLPSQQLWDEKSKVEADFSYDWDISFSTVSPPELALGSEKSVLNVLADIKVMILRQSDVWAKTLNSFLGHPSAPQIRPLLRSAFILVSYLLSVATDFLDFRYWTTRSLTTGIAIPSRLICATVDLAFALVAFAATRISNFDGWFDLGEGIVSFGLRLSLGLRLDWTWGGWGEMIPIRVERRAATRGERRSSRLDMAGFSWTLRVLLLVATFIAWNYIPTPPLISSPSSPHSTASFTLTPHQGSIFLSPSVESIKYSLVTPLWISLLVPQIILNHRSSSFAGSDPLYAMLHCAEWLLLLVTKLLTVAEIEKGEGGDAVTAYDVVGLLLVGTLAWQAWTLKTVEQDEVEQEGE